MFAILKKHLRCNKGEGYVWFLSILIVILMVFMAIFNIMDTTISTKNIRTEIDAAAEDVFGNIRYQSYMDLAKGTTKLSETTYSDTEIMELLAKKVNASFSYVGITPTIRKDTSDGKWLYTITDLKYTYIDDSTGQSTASYKTGDVNRDGFVNQADLSLMQQYLTTSVVPAGCYSGDFDINKDGSVNETDLALLKSIASYYATYSNSAEYTTSVALLIISFRMEMPVKFADFDFGTSVDTYTYTIPLSFKPAK